MKHIEILPIYTKTDDARINAYLNKQRLMRGLIKSQPLEFKRKPLKIWMEEPLKGNGRIRLALAGLALYLVFAFAAWGWL